jgi:[ribosomal protein S5]-alanine N-acetyltransferase
MKIINTPRLTLRPFSIVDASFLIKLMNAPNWLQYIGDRNIRSLAEATHYIQEKLIRSYRERGFGLLHVSITATKEPIGMCGLVKRKGLFYPDLGFAVLPEFENQGYISEAIEAVMHFALQELKLEAVQGITTPDNLASIRLLEKAGMTYKINTTLPDSEKEFMLYSTKTV